MIPYVETQIKLFPLFRPSKFYDIIMCCIMNTKAYLISRCNDVLVRRQIAVETDVGVLMRHCSETNNSGDGCWSTYATLFGDK